MLAEITIPAIREGMVISAPDLIDFSDYQAERYFWHSQAAGCINARHVIRRIALLDGLIEVAHQFFSTLFFRSCCRCAHAGILDTQAITIQFGMSLLRQGRRNRRHKGEF